MNYRPTVEHAADVVLVGFRCANPSSPLLI
jgi:hypothetical protein